MTEQELISRKEFYKMYPKEMSTRDIAGRFECTEGEVNAALVAFMG